MTVPGWYGKLPSLGDFASRRLPSEFIQAWDAWLQEVIPASRASMGEEWVEGYLTMPIWRFVLLPGVIEPSGWAGVLMPSVDRVGRQFPLTVAVALPSDADAAHVIFDGAEWFSGLEDAALSMLDVKRGPDDLDAALDPFELSLPVSNAVNGWAGSVRRLPSVDALGRLAGADALRAWADQSGWRGLWWTRGRMDGDPLMLTCAGLPTAEEFGKLLESRWSPALDAGASPL